MVLNGTSTFMANSILESIMAFTFIVKQGNNLFVVIFYILQHFKLQF